MGFELCYDGCFHQTANQECLSVLCMLPKAEQEDGDHCSRDCLTHKKVKVKEERHKEVTERQLLDIIGLQTPSVGFSVNVLQQPKAFLRAWTMLCSLEHP